MPAALCVLILPASDAAALKQSPPARHRALHQYRLKAINPESAARAVASGSINTARNYPHEWGMGAGGFAKRVGSAFGEHLVKGAIEVGVGALHHEDLRFRRADLHGTWPRFKYAVKSTFIVPRTDEKGKTLAAGRIAGNIGGGLVSRAWQPRVRPASAPGWPVEESESAPMWAFMWPGSSGRSESTAPAGMSRK